MDFVVPADHKVKLKESEKCKYMDLAWELKKMRNMKVTVTPIVIGALVQSIKDRYKGWGTWKYDDE